MKFLQYIKEIFDSHHFTWIKNQVALFQIQNRDYYVHFDLIGDDAYNFYFYFLSPEGNRVVDLIHQHNNAEFKIFSNVIHIVEDYWQHHNINFLGFSSLEDERDALYFLFLQKLERPGYRITMKEGKFKKYYFIYKTDQEIYTPLYIKRFMESDFRKKDKEI